jgi:TetR/AcrR family transcriptional regulator, cholesterol catabolism regulator
VGTHTAVKRAPQRTKRADAKREKILDAAASVLAERGFAGTTLAEIAEKAGTLAGSLYYHFDSREHLVTEVLIKGIRDSRDYVEAALSALPEDASPRDRVATSVRAHLETVVERSDAARAGVRSIGQVPDSIDAMVDAERDAYGAVFHREFSRAQAEGFFPPSVDVVALRLLAIGAGNFAIDWFRADGRVSLDELGDLLVAMTLAPANRRR